MAGIGFELRKAIKQSSPAQRMGGYLGAAFSSSGSMMMGIIVFVMIQMQAHRSGVSQDVTDAFMCYVTNVMFGSMLAVSPFTLLLSRYVSNQMYLQRQEKVMPSLIGAVLLISLCGGVMITPLLMASRLELLPAYLLASFFIILNLCWLLMTYITLLRDYKKIVAAYLAALLCAAALLGIIALIHALSLTTMILILLLFFAVVDMLLFRALYHGFSKQDGSVWEFLIEARTNPRLMCIGLFLTCGMLGHFWVVWFLSDYGQAVDTLFRFGPDYDFPAIIAYFSTIPATIFFVTIFETSFSECYRTYFNLLGYSGTVSQIEKAKERMFEALYKGFRTLCSIQMVTCLLFVTVGAKLLDVLNIGMTQDMLNTFRVFCVGYSLYYIGNVVTLIQLYFVNEKQVFWTALFFAVGSNLATLAGIRYFKHSWGAGFTCVSFLWAAITSFQMVRFLSKLEYHVLGKQPLTVRRLREQNQKFHAGRCLALLQGRYLRCAALMSMLLVLFNTAVWMRNVYRMSLIKEFVPQASTVALKSPGMGLAPWAENTESMEMDTTLVYVELKWADWEPEEGVYDVEFVTEYYNLEYYREDGRQVVFRFICDEPTEESHIDIPDWLYELTADGDFYDTSYGKGYAPNYANEILIEKHKQAIAALGEAFGADDFFCYVELGSLGHWGEWHVNYEQGVTRLPEYEVRKQYIEPYLKAFPNARFLMRYPLIDATENDFGLYNDMTGDYEETLYWLEQMQGGIWEQTGLEEQAVCTDVWKTQPIGGEFASTYDDRTFLIDNFELTLESIKESHQSFIGPKIIIDESDNKSYSAAMDEILACLGYRLRVSNLKLDLTSKEIITATCTMTNDGIAPIYASDYQVKLYLYDENKEQVWESENISFDLSAVLPGEEHEWSATIGRDELDDDMQYTICAAIVDADGKACVPMALSDVMENNIYILAEFSV